MRVHARLFASLARQRPDQPPLDLPGGAVVADACRLLGLDPQGVVAILDGAPAGPETALREGAVLELLPIVEGG